VGSADALGEHGLHFSLLLEEAVMHNLSLSPLYPMENIILFK